MRIPDKFSRRGPGKITNVGCFEAPGFHIGCAVFLVAERLRRRDDIDGPICRCRLLHAFALQPAEDVTCVFQCAGCGNSVIGRYADRYVIVAELQRELTAAEKLLVVPALVVGVDDHAGKPLRNEEDIVAIGCKVFVTTPCPHRVFFDQPVVPVNAETDALTAGQRLCQIDAQQRADDRVREALTAAFHPGDVVAAIEFGHELQLTQFVKRQLLAFAQGLRPIAD